MGRQLSNTPTPTGHPHAISPETTNEQLPSTNNLTTAAAVTTTAAAQPAAVAATAANTKIARQEQLVRKLVLTLPGSTDEQIRQYIQVLRVKHGKLSGWPTSKIATHIAELMKNE